LPGEGHPGIDDRFFDLCGGDTEKAADFHHRWRFRALSKASAHHAACTDKKLKQSNLAGSTLIDGLK
jgi:hypothetical protein